MCICVQTLLFSTDPGQSPKFQQHLWEVLQERLEQGCLGNGISKSRLSARAPSQCLPAGSCTLGLRPLEVRRPGCLNSGFGATLGSLSSPALRVCKGQAGDALEASGSPRKGTKGERKAGAAIWDSCGVWHASGGKAMRGLCPLAALTSLMR